MAHGCAHVTELLNTAPIPRNEHDQHPDHRPAIGVFVVLQISLTVMVGYRRARTGIQFLDGGDQTLLRRMRAHGNYTRSGLVGYFRGHAMELSVNVFDLWVFRKTPDRVEYLLLYTSQNKADRYFNGGRFWQIPSDAIEPGETVTSAITRRLCEFGLVVSAIWAAEHTYAIYNRRFECMQLIGVYAADAASDSIRLDPAEHSEYRWCSFEEALALVHYRGLKDGLRSTLEYVTGVEKPARELQLL